ncbi:unnamed protein product [Calicophoron daubneyi]
MARDIKPVSMKIDLLESVGNMRQRSRPASCSRPRSTLRPKKAPVVRPATALGHTRLRLDEAFENAARNRRGQVFDFTDPAIKNIPWTPRRPLTADHNILGQKNVGSSELPPPRVPSARVSFEGVENRMRSLGTLSLKQLPTDECKAEVQGTIHIRCPSAEAMENLYISQRGKEVRELLNQQSGVPITPRKTDTQFTARAPGEYSCLKGSEQISSALDQGFSSEIYRAPERSEQLAPNVKLRHPDSTGSQVAAVLGHPELSPGVADHLAARAIPPTAAPNAAREGAAMAERFHLSNHPDQFKGDPYEINKARETALTSRDMTLFASAPKVKYEGIENAKRGRGTLSTWNYHSPQTAPNSPMIPRVRPEAVGIAEANRGNASKLLLSRARVTYTYMVNS